MRKIVSLFVIVAMIASMGMTAFGFNFPVPDWGALLKEKTAMVEATDFELYAQGATDSAPYYGAKFEPRAGAYLGAVPEKSESLEPYGAYLTYIEGMRLTDFYYPVNQMLPNANVITLAGWTIDDLGSIDYNHVNTTLATINGYNKPILVRFTNEMNCSSLGDDPQKYVEVFRKVADMIHQYPNLGVVWSPNDMGALDRPFEYFYPGDKYVDWIGVSCYMHKFFQGNANTQYKDTVYFMTNAYAWATNKIKPILDFMKKNNIKKPLMLSESGVATNNKYGDDYKSWAIPRLRNLLWYVTMKYPQVKMINYFDVYRENAAERFNISQYDYARDIFNEAKKNGIYLTGYGDAADFVFQPANNAGTLIAKDNKVSLYTLAYIANQPDISVNYHIDGKWYHSSNQIPYICNMNISKLSDGKHTLKISTLDLQKEYTFYKQGNCIRFGAQPDASVVKKAQDKVYVKINGKTINFDQDPVIHEGRTLVPLRAIFEELGAEVEWNGDTQTVTAYKDGTTVSMKVGTTNMAVNDKVLVLDVAAMLINGRTLVPARAVSEAFSCKVDWDSTSRTVIITK